jgi:hypothetical protein
MVSIKLQVGKSIAGVLRRATKVTSVVSEPARRRSVTAEEAEAWVLQAREMRARLKAEADSPPWSID